MSFQFHKGTIRTRISLNAICLFCHFNSIKVRLEHSHKFKRYMPFLSFQFHKGTIRTQVTFLDITATPISIP